MAGGFNVVSLRDACRVTQEKTLTRPTLNFHIIFRHRLNSGGVFQDSCRFF